MPKKRLPEQTQTNERTVPRPGRLHIPGYGISKNKRGLLDWNYVSEQMSSARNYWIGTTRPDGRPHIMPVWGVWVDGTFYFGTGQSSRKAQNLTANPALTVHLESGDEVVILEGIAEAVTDMAQLKPVDDAYFAKYKMRALGMPGSVIYALRPRVVFAWRERDFPTSATRWQFVDN
jgi:general stress protein 26